MTKIGIDKLGLYTPGQYMDLVDLAKERGVDPNKYTIGIGQNKMAVPGPTQDAVTMGANAANQILDEADKQDISLLILGTESGVDASKAGSLYIQNLLELNPWMRAIEIKEACYGATAGLRMAQDFIAAHPGKKALVIASDIARYGLGTAGEVTQGAGAIAMLITENPRIIALDPDGAYMSESIQDFWRPTYSDTAFARGHYSTEQYIRFFDETWAKYKEITHKNLNDFKAFCFHLPYTKMGLKAFKTVLPEVDVDHQEALLHEFDYSTWYSRQIGNIYTGSVYLSLLSLLENSEDLKAGDQIGIFSYGSGAVGEIFAGELQPGFEQQLHATENQAYLDDRQSLSFKDYEKLFMTTLPTDGSSFATDASQDKGPFYVAGIKDHERLYNKK